jgi:hypothetical protein
MKVFLSYSRKQRRRAEEISTAIRVRGHDVFFDESNLKAGLEFDPTIEKAVSDCNLFVFLISPDSVKPSSYSITELGFAKGKWPNPSGYVLPVMVEPTLLAKVDPYLRGVTILYPQGNLAAEVSASVDRLANTDASAPHAEPPTPELVLLQRIDAYKELWGLTKRLPKWPRATDVSYDDLREFSASLRGWYFTDGGGLFLSRQAHTAYSALQDSLTAILMGEASGVIRNEHYDAVRELCSALRTTLARDIGSRV